MPCESIDSFWDNNLHCIGTSSSFQNCASSRSIRSQRLGSVGVSFSSDSETSMAQDSGDELQFVSECVSQDPDWDEHCFISTQANSTVTCVDNSLNSYNSCASVTCMPCYSQAASSSCDPTPYSTLSTSIHCMQSPPLTCDDVHLNTSHSLNLIQPQIINNYHSSSSCSSIFFPQDWTSGVQDETTSLLENQIELSDVEENGNETSYKLNSENRYSTFTTATRNPSVLSTARTLGERNLGGDQLRYYNQNVGTGRHGLGGSRQRTGKQPILSHFLYHALENPSQYNTMIRWVNRDEGTFEFQSKNKESLARAWGMVKNNRRCMTYPKMARALRKYIENGIVLKKLKNRLRYSFLPNFLHDLRSGNEPRQLSSHTIQQMYTFSRSNYLR